MVVVVAVIICDGGGGGGDECGCVCVDTAGVIDRDGDCNGD